MRILAVDDDPCILELMPLLVAISGFPDVTTAPSGQRALDALANSDDSFDCLLLDINMPGMDGV
ncbi:MAG: srrA, partial [Cypionkella sp.]|uniref:response regulator n=1 Tax=Cypionkella sp. TaxID=2811411 RepID=UPI00260A49AD